MKTLTVIQHTSAEYLGQIEDHLEGRRIRFRYSRPFASGGRVPKPGQLLDGLVLLGVSEFWQMVVKGLVIVLAVVLDQFQRRSS